VYYSDGVSDMVDFDAVRLPKRLRLGLKSLICERSVGEISLGSYDVHTHVQVSLLERPVRFEEGKANYEASKGRR
jgi:hypothetical protein